MKFSLNLLVSFLLCLFLSIQGIITPSQARDEVTQGVVAVNEDIITPSDVENRMRLISWLAGISVDSSFYNQMREEVIASLIDERLKLQEAQEKEINIDEIEVQSALTTVEANNNLPEGSLKQVLAEQNINFQTLVDQIKANLLWMKLVREYYAPGRIQIGEKDIDRIVHRIELNRQFPHYLVAEIYLPVDNENQDSIVAQHAIQIVQEARSQKGKNFEVLAHQFSRAASAASGGDIGWIQVGMFANSNLEAVLQNLQIGEISDPIRTDNGYYILYLRDLRKAEPETRDIFLSLQEVSVPFPLNATSAQRQEQKQQSQALLSRSLDCSSFQKFAQQIPGAQVKWIEGITLDDVPPEIRGLIQNLAIGEMTPIIENSKGLVVMMLCERAQRQSGYLDRSQVMKTLEIQRLTLLDQQVLREVREAAFIKKL